ncbi:glycogen/starch/alpha-glucan family phosphorylase [Eggerthellaceae bacterium zg-893]|nr:glycogen/starch/alpha-glucan family phosphorylase [Eggerthellaceae bacterium zg-893]
MSDDIRNNPPEAGLAERAAETRSRIEEKVRKQFAIPIDEATPEQVYEAVGLCVRDDIMDSWITWRTSTQRSGAKCVIYLSAEFLIGRLLTNNLINLGKYECYEAALRELGYDMATIEEVESDPALGNGGLGRLAACFMDSLATLGLPSMGYGIRYEYGFFRQEIRDGRQVEIPDNWAFGGAVWETARTDRTYEVRFGGTVEENWNSDGNLRVEYRDYQSVIAKPYDMPVVGYRSPYTGTLRLWSAVAPKQLDLVQFNRGDYESASADRELAESISKVLYPEDSHPRGKELRLRQQYFLVSATMQQIVDSHRRRNGDLRKLPDAVVVQINDTHPTLAIPELIRILIDNEGFSWEEAVEIAERTFNYTNHTLLPEALECWPAPLMRSLLPRIYRIIETIDARLRDRIWQTNPGDADLISRLAIIHDGKVRMANLCVLMSTKVNGVSQLHGKLLKTRLFRDFYVTQPEKFLGITNGITQRRWLAVANPRLNSLINDTIGEGFMRDWTKLEELVPYAEDASFRQKFDEVKRENKRDFATWLERTHGISIDPESFMDVQAKRLHEYKRQLLKAVHILSIYDGLVSGRITDMPKVSFVFAAKAAPGYVRAKDTIRLINAISRLVAGNERTRDAMSVVFVPNYDVSTAQVLMPATDLSEQISTAGFEASGTGNMKFMLNGALTIGTMDGANIEMAEEVGEENMFIFGARVEEIDRMKADHSYRPREVAQADGRLQKALEHLIDGSLPTSDNSRFEDLYHSLMDSDPYFALYDFDAYDKAFWEALRVYGDRDEWLRRAVLNTARSGYFSSDRTINEYNEAVWHLTPIDDAARFDEA